MTRDFFSPRLTGARFDDHTVPADILPDVAALQEMLVELAKAAYREEHPERVRAPRNFNTDVQVHLAAIEDGSAKLRLVLFFSGLLVPYESAFTKAQAQITQAIEAVSAGHQPAMNSKYLAYFERVGRGLLEGESIDFPTPDGYAVLNRERRLELIQASQVEEWTERATLQVRIPMTDYRIGKYDVQMQDGTTVSGKLTPTIYDQLADAHRAYGTGQNEWLRLECVVLKHRSGNVIKGVESVENVNLIDPLDIAARLQDLAALQTGWLNGEGVAFSKKKLVWVEQKFRSFFGDELPLPRIYPTPEANILAEWLFGRSDVSLEIDLSTEIGEYSVLNLDLGEVEEQTINLADEAGWKRLNELLGTFKVEREQTA